MARFGLGVRTCSQDNLEIAARSSPIDRCHNLFDMQSHDRPLRSAQHYDSNLAASKILLVSNVLVAGKKNLEPGPLRFGDEIAIGKPVPSAFLGPE